jgi:hypothetical protein|tara:strand:- start:43 stop:348 length:306 start_codon:yes stop_codon:yes gene_type:complete
MEILYEEGDNGFIGIVFDEVMNVWTMHIECHSWSHNKFKRYLKALEVVKEKLRERGIKKVYGLCRSKKERKFNIVFGAKAVPDGILLTEDGILNYITVLET